MRVVILSLAVIENLLPKAVLAKATRTGNELAWPLADVPEVINAAETRLLANLGGQPQFVYPEGTCEPFWLNADADSRREDETWEEYVRRSADEIRTGFKRIVSETDFEKEARSFSFLAKKLERGEDVMSQLRFVLYFADESAV